MIKKMENKMTTHKYITEEAKNDEGLSIHNTISFHCFNPNGLVATKNKQNDEISKLVDEGKAKSGAIIAYGTFSHYEYDRLFEILRKKRVSRIEMNTTIRMFEDHNKSAKEFINEQLNNGE